MLPNFLLIGPGRAGSSWCARNLMQHPEIFIPREKSTKYFTSNYHRGKAWYEKHFANRNEKAIGEASVGYLENSDVVPGRIKETLADITMIATLRDPVERAFSSYGRLRATAKPGSRNYSISFEDKIGTTDQMLSIGLYAEHLKRFYKYFDKDQILVLFYDDLRSNPNEYLKQIYKRLDVDVGFESPVAEQTFGSTATLMAKRSSPLYYVYRALLRLNMFGMANVLEGTIRQEKPVLRQETRQRLIAEYYSEDILELEEMLGRDLSSWKE